MEIIEQIKEVENRGFVDADKTRRIYDGYCITTSERPIYLLIQSGQDCCEQWGYLMSEDNLDQFIGAQLRHISITDTKLRTYEFPQDTDGLYTMFVNLETDRGLLQFVAYNAHNGYYGHKVKIRAGEFQHEEWL